MKKLVFGMLLALVASSSYAKVCINQLQEEANVFEVNCISETKMCFVTGYFTHPKLKVGYSGVVATFQSTPANQKQTGSQLIINTYRHGEPKVITPTGYFDAMMTAEKMLIGEQHMYLTYFDARTGKIVPRPNIKCE